MPLSWIKFALTTLGHMNMNTKEEVLSYFSVIFFKNNLQRFSRLNYPLDPQSIDPSLDILHFVAQDHICAPTVDLLNLVSRPQMYEIRKK